MVLELELLDSKRLLLSLAAGTGKTLRPAHIMGSVFQLNAAQIKQARVVKLKARG